jgi:hypothetical protein
MRWQHLLDKETLSSAGPLLIDLLSVEHYLGGYAATDHGCVTQRDRLTLERLIVAAADAIAANSTLATASQVMPSSRSKTALARQTVPARIKEGPESPQNWFTTGVFPGSHGFGVYQKSRTNRPKLARRVSQSR